MIFLVAMVVMRVVVFGYLQRLCWCCYGGNDFFDCTGVVLDVFFIIHLLTVILSFFSRTLVLFLVICRDYTGYLQRN